MKDQCQSDSKGGRTRNRLAVAIAMGLFALSTVAVAVEVEFQGRTLDIATPGEKVAGEIVVVPETPGARKAIRNLAAEAGARVKGEIPDTGMQLWKFEDAAAAKAALARVGKIKGFHAFENTKVSIPPPPGVMRQLRDHRTSSKAPALGKMLATNPDEAMRKLLSGGGGDVGVKWSTNDVAVPNQWALSMINEPLAPAPPAAPISPATALKGIAIIDTGVDYTHPDLAGKVTSVWDYVDNDNDAMDVHGHGTHCAGIAAAKANNTAGIRGVSPNSRIYAYRVLNEFGSGGDFDVIAAIRAAANNTAVHVISLSLGGYDLEGSTAYNDMKAAVDYAVVTKGKILVSSAGNEENDYLYFYQWAGYKYRPTPAYYPNSFTVAATTETDSRAYFSNYDVSNRASPDGTEIYTWNFVDIAAPGANILSTTMDAGYEKWSGTSMAAPLVAGAAARVWDTKPAETATQIRARLVNYGTLLSAANGFPAAERRLDLYKALGLTFPGGFFGRVLHGELGQPLGGVKVEALKTGTTTVAASTTTTAAGFYNFTNLASNTAGYTLRLSKTGYVTRTTHNLGNRPAGILTNVYNEPILPSRASTTADENWRIVVYWRHQNPGFDYFYDGWYWDGFADYFPYTYYHAAGLEANAYLRQPSGSLIYWGNTGSLTASPYIKFMHDSWSDDRPIETHIIRDQATGTYKYWLNVDPENDAWGAIKYGLGTTANPSYPSLPKVMVYKGNTPIRTIDAAAATRVGTGTKYWNVLTLSGGTVTTVNQVTDTSP